MTAADISPYVRSGADGSGCTFKGAKRAYVKIVTGAKWKGGKKKKKDTLRSQRIWGLQDFLILACGSKAQQRLPDPDGSGYELAKQFGHRIIKPLPALVQLRCEGDLLPKASGVRVDALVSIQTADGKTAAKDRGELQITDYGISGIPVFQVLGYAAKLLDQKKKVLASLNFLPDLDETKVGIS